LREIARRLGAASQNFFSLLQSKETAADVAAIMEFIRLHPDWLPKREIQAGGGTSEPQFDGTRMVDIDDLIRSGRSTHLPHASSTTWSTEVRFMQDVFAAFNKRRGPIDATAANRGSDSNVEDDDANENSDGAARDTAKALASFDRLLDHLLDEDEDRRQSLRAFQITQYVCERLEVEPFQKRSYLDRLVHSFTRESVTEEARDFFAALALLWANQSAGDLLWKASLLRRQLLRVSDMFPDAAPSLDIVGGFGSGVINHEDAGNLWDSALTQRTIQEEMRLFWSNQSVSLSSKELPRLARLPEWPSLECGPSPRIVRMLKYSEYCPHCYIALSGVEATRLRNVGVATCPRGRILMCEEY